MVPSPLFGALKEVAQHLGKKLDAIVAAIKGQEFPQADYRPLIAAVKSLENTVAKQKPAEFSGKVTVDQTEIKRELREIAKKLSFPEIDNSDVVAAIKTLKFESKELDLTPLLDEIRKLKLEVPATFKIDEMQVAKMAQGGGSGMAPMTMATRVSNTTVAISDAATEASYTFPAGTVGWLIKLRDQGTLGYYSWTTGKLPTSGDGSTYMTIPQNFLRSQQDVEYGGKTMYLGAEAAATVEIEVFRR